METRRRFLLISILLVAAPLPAIFWMLLNGGGARDAVEAVTRWLALWVIYWLPIGWLLFGLKTRTWLRLVAGYALSIPLYFAALWLVYPAFGADFHPMAHGLWRIYLTATPQFFLMVLAARHAARWRIALAGAAAVFAAGMVAPAWLSATSRLDWPNTASSRVAIEGARIVDPETGAIAEGKTVYIENGKIAAISDGHPDARWTRIEANGHYLLAGLIDVHTHLQSPVEVRTGFDFGYFMRSMISRYEPQRRAYLESGVTTVRDLGGPAAHSFEMRREIDARRMLGPRLLTAGRLVTVPLGHPVSTIWSATVARDGAILATDERSMIEGLDRNFADGPPDVVKFVHGTIGRAKKELSPALLTRGVRWARDHNLSTVAHVETAAEFEDAIAAGVTGLEHAAYLDALPPSLNALVRTKQPFIDPTFGEFETDMILRKMEKARRDREMQRRYEVVRELAQAGAHLVIGTDAPMVAYGSGFHDELDHFAWAGFSNAQILTMATTGNARYVGRANEIGRIAPGFAADLVLSADNPLLDLKTLRHPLWTMREGQIAVRAR